MTRTLMLAMLFALAGCGSGSQTPSPAETSTAPAASSASAALSPATAPSTAAPVVPTSTPTTSQDLAVLESRDCRMVAEAYTDAIAHDDFDFAARVWNDPVVDAARLKAVFTPYAVPQIEIGKVREEGAAGSLYCTVTGTLTDVADTNKPTQSGEIVLRRVNDVPGATRDQLRWTIQSSTFVEKLQRSSKGGAT